MKLMFEKGSKVAEQKQRKKEQANNTRSTTHITYCGVTRTYQEWTKLLGFKKHTIRNRVNKYNWSIEKAITTPQRRGFMECL